MNSKPGSSVILFAPFSAATVTGIFLEPGGKKGAGANANASVLMNLLRNGHDDKYGYNVAPEQVSQLVSTWMRLWKEQNCCWVLTHLRFDKTQDTSDTCNVCWASSASSVLSL